MTAAVSCVQPAPNNGSRPHPDRISTDNVWTADLVKDYLTAYPLLDASDILEVERVIEYFSIAASRIPSQPGRQAAAMVMEDHLISAQVHGARAHKMVEAALREQHIPTPDAVATPRSIDDLLADESLEGEPQWIVEGYFARGEVGLLAAAPKIGKTTTLAHLTGAVVCGTSFLGRKVTHTPALWVDMEQHARQTKRLFSDLGVQGLPLYTVTTQMVTFDICDFAKEKGVGLVVIDSLSKYWDVTDENDAAQVTAAMRPIRQLAEDTDAAVVLIHHNRKSGGEDGVDIRGSVAIHATVDVAISMKRDKDHETRRYLEATSRHDETPRKLVVEFEDGVFRALGTASEVKSRENQSRLLEVLTDEPLTIDEISEASELSKPVTQRTTRQMFKNNTISRVGTGKRGDPFRFCRVVSNHVPLKDSGDVIRNTNALKINK